MYLVLMVPCSVFSLVGELSSHRRWAYGNGTLLVLTSLRSRRMGGIRGQSRPKHRPRSDDSAHDSRSELVRQLSLPLSTEHSPLSRSRGHAEADPISGFAGTILYSSAVFPARQGDSFGIMMLFKSAITFGFLYFSTDWLVERGPFCTWGGVCCGVSLLALPFYVYGKRIREWTSQSALLGWTTR
jgi:hypothetical protein